METSSPQDIPVCDNVEIEQCQKGITMHTSSVERNSEELISFDSSDTSALMELAEIACNSTNRPGSSCKEELEAENLVLDSVSNLQKKYTLAEEISESTKEKELLAHDDASNTIPVLTLDKEQNKGTLKEENVTASINTLEEEKALVNEDIIEQENTGTSETQKIISETRPMHLVEEENVSDENISVNNFCTERQGINSESPKHMLSETDIPVDNRNNKQEIVSSELYTNEHTNTGSGLLHENTTGNEEHIEEDLRKINKQSQKTDLETLDSLKDVQAISAVADETDISFNSERLGSDIEIKSLEDTAQLSSISSVVECVQLTEKLSTSHEIPDVPESITDAVMDSESNSNMVSNPINEVRPVEPQENAKSDHDSPIPDKKTFKEVKEQDLGSKIPICDIANSDFEFTDNVSTVADQISQNIGTGILLPENQDDVCEKKITSKLNEDADVLEKLSSSSCAEPIEVSVTQHINEASSAKVLNLSLESDKSSTKSPVSMLDEDQLAPEDILTSGETTTNLILEKDFEGASFQLNISIAPTSDNLSKNKNTCVSEATSTAEPNKSNDADTQMSLTPSSGETNKQTQVTGTKINEIKKNSFLRMELESIVDLPSEISKEKTDIYTNNVPDSGISEPEKFNDTDKDVSFTETQSGSATNRKLIECNKPACDSTVTEPAVHDESVDISTSSKVNKENILAPTGIAAFDKKSPEQDKSVSNSQRESCSKIVSTYKNTVGKLFVRNDLTETKGTDNKDSIHTEATKNVPKEIVPKKRPHEFDSEASPDSKKINKTMVEDDEDNDESDADDEKLIIDEDGASSAPRRRSQKEKRKGPRCDVKTDKEKNAATNLRSQIWIADFAKAPPTSPEASLNLPKGKCEKSIDTLSTTPDNHTSTMAVEVVDLVEKEKESLKKTDDSLSGTKNHICEKCKTIWNDRVLKCLFEGNESVTINSRISYGAIICMNIYVAIHYPDVKEQAIFGLLDRADLAKNLGSIKVSILNSWLVALIKNKKINCCDPFRPIYNKVKTQSSKEKQSAKEARNIGSDKTVQSLQQTQDDKERSDSSLSNDSEVGGISKSSTAVVPEITIDDGEEDNSRDEHALKKGPSTPQTPIQVQVQKGTSVPLTQTSLFTTQQENRRYVTNECIYKKLISKISPALYNTILLERESLSPNLHGIYDKLTCDTILSENESKNLKRKNLTNKEVLDIHSLCILSAKEIFVEDYFKLFVQILHHRGHVLLIPTGKILVKYVEYLRREHNRQKMATKLKCFATYSWDADHLYAVPFLKNNKVEGEFPTIREILTVFCEWKNRNLLRPSQNQSSEKNLQDVILNVFNNKVKIKDCLGLCVRLYARYCHLKFDQTESEESKTKLFLNLYYLPEKERESVTNKVVFDTSMSLFPSESKDIDSTVSYLEDETQTINNLAVKRKLPDDIIESKIEQMKKLKANIITSVKTTKSAYLLNSYAKLKNEINYLEAPIKISVASAEDLTVFNKQMASYTPEVKLMVAKLQSANVPFESIPSVIDTLFRSFLKRKVPVSC